jgi:hypothetical protein
MRTMVVQNITVFHNWGIDYYHVGEIDIYNTDAKGRKTKRISLIWHRRLKSYWKQNMKEIPYWWIFESFDFELINACENFIKMIKLCSWAMDRTSD